MTLQFGSVTKRLLGYYSPYETTTIVLGAAFDDGDWWAAQKDRTLHLFKEGQLRAQFPRDLKIDAGADHLRDFLTRLGPLVEGKRRHSLYPLPDTVFTWHTHKANVVTAPHPAGPGPFSDRGSWPSG